ncbi:glycosyltransferase [Chitinophaga sedimenti]|uniref:glycosyltransferase n=1 Tax=Chitinophaga sedimenti TaxID=2033606 RepID=UPI0020069C30|nr:glycosyltransferase [Chitinophaga sedimenti]MCK7555278.1 glycosyltransferase [Chitinophaga sedimenti]
MITGKDIVVVGMQSWDITIGSNCKNIAWELAKHNRVLYVNRALDRISAIRLKHEPDIQNRLKSLRGETDDIQQIAPQLWTLNPRTLLESANWMPTPFLFDFVNKLNNKRIAKQVTKAMQRLGFGDIILFNDNDFFRNFYMQELLPGVKSTIYYIRDNLVSQPYFSKQGKRLEPMLMAKSDLVVANSAYLADYGRQHNPRSYDIGQGCEFELFTQAGTPVRPTELEGIKGPIIGYVGALLTARLDIGILEHIATARPDWSIVLVGPEDGNFQSSRLHQLPNVHFTGSRPGSMLPAFIHYFDVCINPQALNDMTIGNYPRKVDEYLAMGKPVVATETVAMRMFAGHTYLCKNAAEYVQQIDNILNNPVAESVVRDRITFALSHTWENSVEAMSKHYFELPGVAKPATATAL